MPFLPYGRQYLDDDDIAAVTAVLRGDWLTTGPAVTAFESELATVTGARHAIAVSSGTAALHLAVLAAGIGPGDVAIVPAITFVATANAIRLAGARVVFADVDPNTGLTDATRVAAGLARAGVEKPAAMLPVHMGGQVADPAGIADLAERLGAVVIEDACHALGTVYDSGTPVGDGRNAAMSAFSMHPVKTVVMGEGGAVTTNDSGLAERLRRLRSHGISRDTNTWLRPDLAIAPDGTANPWYYEATEVGLNYRASDIHCALGLSQLRKLTAFAAERKRLVACYDTALTGLAPQVRRVPAVVDCDPAWHLCQVLIDFEAVGRTRADIMNALRARGIGTQVHYIPVPWHPLYREGNPPEAFPGARRFYDRCLALPLYVGMTDADVDRVVAALGEVLNS